MQINLCNNEIIVNFRKDGGLMNYLATVDRVMSLLKEKKVCSGSRKSYKGSYNFLKGFLNQTEDEWLSYYI